MQSAQAECIPPFSKYAKPSIATSADLSVNNGALQCALRELFWVFMKKINIKIESDFIYIKSRMSIMSVIVMQLIFFIFYFIVSIFLYYIFNNAIVLLLLFLIYIVMFVFFVFNKKEASDEIVLVINKKKIPLMFLRVMVIVIKSIWVNLEK